MQPVFCFVDTRYASQGTAGNKKGRIKDPALFIFGRSGGIRTHDPLTPSQVRYQTALRSEKKDSRDEFWERREYTRWLDVMQRRMTSGLRFF